MICLISFFLCPCSRGSAPAVDYPEQRRLQQGIASRAKHVQLPFGAALQKLQLPG